MTRRPYFLLASLILFLRIHSQSYYFKQFTAEQGLPDNYVYSSMQDKEGYLWICTGKGLVTFDGQLFMNANPDSLADGDFVFTSTQTKNNMLWFGSYGGKLFYTQHDKPVLFSTQINGPINLLVASRHSDNLYIVSNGNGIYSLQGTKLQLFEKTKYIPVQTLVELDADHLLIGGMEGLYLLTMSKQRLVKLNVTEGNYKQIQLLKHKKNTCYVMLSEQGVFELSVPLNAGESDVLPMRKVYQSKVELNSFYFHEEDGFLYAGTRDEQLEVVNTRNGFIQVPAASEFSGMASQILFDKEQNIWICTSGNGLFRLYKRDYEVIQSGNRAVFAIAQGINGFLYLGTDEGLLVLDESGREKTLLKQLNQTNLGKVTALHLDKQGCLWIGTSEHGLFVMEAGSLRVKALAFSKIPNIAINSITSNPYDQEIQVNTNLDGVYAYRGYELYNHFSSENSLLHNNVYYSLKLKNGKVYYATHNTAFNFSSGDQLFEIDVKNNGLLSDFNSFAEDPEGRLVIGTNGDGLYILQDTLVSTFPFNKQFENRYCSGLISDRSGSLWVMFRYQLYRYYYRDSILKLMNTGLSNQVMLNANAACLSPAGDLFFGTSKHVLVFRSQSLQHNQQVLPKSHLIRVQLSDSTKQFDEEGVLPFGRYDLRFEFSALSLRSSEDVQFSYMLKGRDNNWSPWSHIREVEFTNLTDGDYTLMVRAMNSEGFTETTPMEFHFVIDKPFWKKWWFWLFAAVVLVGSVLGFVRIRTRALIRAKERLERLVDEKTHELREEKERVEANNVIIAKQNEDITSSITYAKRIQEAILPQTQSEAGKGIPSLMIFFRPKDIVSGDFYWYAHKDNRLLIAACDCTGHGVPGAFMSMIGTTLFNKIVFDKGMSDPNEILLNMDMEITKSLKQENNELKDGMEAGLCSIDFEARQLAFSGAKRPLWLYRPTEDGFSFTEIKGDKFPIGGYDEVIRKSYQLHSVDLLPGDTLYMFSDGITDQFRRDDHKRLSSKRLKEFLHQIAGKPLVEQYSLFSDFMDNWKGDVKQTDDMLFIGIRI